MAFTNTDAKEINCKIVYLGAPKSGKTANLRAIYASLAQEVKAGLVELSEVAEQTKLFDFLPLSLGQVHGHHLKLHLLAMPLLTPHTTLRSILLRGVDGVVFVLDSSVERVGDNVDAFNEMKNIFKNEGLSVLQTPMVLQFNKRDLPNTVPLDILRSEFLLSGAQEIEAIATEELGTMETLKAVTKQILLKMALN